jgi:DMSO/TMAO reductase YedYZ heme-binding membrane subunit
LSNFMILTSPWHLIFLIVFCLFTCQKILKDGREW